MTVALRETDAPAVEEMRDFNGEMDNTVLTDIVLTATFDAAPTTMTAEQLGELDDELDEAMPAPEWDLGRLGRRADFEGKQITDCEIDAAPHYWVIGIVLRLAKPGVAHGEWGHWLKAHGIDASRAFRARLLAAAFASLDQLEGLTLREAIALALAARGEKPQDVKLSARRRLRAMTKTLTEIEEDIKDLDDRATLLPLIEAVELGLASLRRALKTP